MWSVGGCSSDHLFRLNYAIMLYNNDKPELALPQYKQFKTLWHEVDEETKASVRAHVGRRLVYA
jgi:hypothetical protein